MTEGSRAVRAAARRVRWRERLFGLARQLLPDADRSWREGALILLYHRIADAPGEDPFAVALAEFDRQVEWLRARFGMLSVNELVARMAHGGDVRGLAAITFDDGYDCTVSRALPVLRRHGVTATVFVDTGRLNAGGSAPRESDVRALATAGIEIGSHTVNHPNLMDVDDATLARELHESRERLEGLIGKPVAGFAHPFGRYDARVTRAVADAGYAYACTCRQHRTVRANDDVYQLTRVEINASDDARRFAAKARGRYAPLYSAWYRLNPATREWLRN